VRYLKAIPYITGSFYFILVSSAFRITSSLTSMQPEITYIAAVEVVLLALVMYNNSFLCIEFITPLNM